MNRRWSRRWAPVAPLIAGVVGPAVARAQEPLPPLPPPVPGEAPVIIAPPAPIVPTPHHHGPIARTAHHIGFTLKDKLIGYPDQFPQPPLGYYVRQNNGAQVARAEQHSFTLYRSDFWAGTDQLTPRGAARVNRMLAKLDCWNGPLLVEVDPDRPELAQMRRESLVANLQRSGFPFDPARLVVGPSPYLGLRGDIAGGASVITGYDGIIINRSYAAPTELELPPNQNNAILGNGGGSGGGGGSGQ